MKLISLIFILLISFSLSSAKVQISEVEQNPQGTDKGAEWLELFSDEKETLDGWKLVNERGTEYLLDGKINGYKIITFENSFLRNTEAEISLYDEEGDLVDETDSLSDEENNEKTFQLCDEWIFEKETRDEENFCEILNETEAESNETVQEKVETETPKEIFVEEEPPQIISLNSQEENLTANLSSITGEVVYESTNQKIANYAIYAFAGFLILLIIVILLRE